MPIDETLSLGLGRPNFSFVDIYLLIHLCVHPFFLLVLHLILSGLGSFVGGTLGALLVQTAAWGGAGRGRGRQQRRPFLPPAPCPPPQWEKKKDK